MKKLNFELVPDGCWYSNLRTVLPAKLWNYVRKDAIKRSGGKCTVCGRETDKLEAHERWSYDTKKGVQKLEDVVAVCHDCHAAIHIERTQLKGNPEKAEDHYMKVNGCSYAEMKKDRSDANRLQKERNQVPEWKLDISWLKNLQ